MSNNSTTDTGTTDISTIDVSWAYMLFSCIVSVIAIVAWVRKSAANEKLEAELKRLKMEHCCREMELLSRYMELLHLKRIVSDAIDE
jgi:hypothetical protein